MPRNGRLSSQKVTVDEAYQVLLASRLTVLPSGSFFKIVDTMDASHEAPVRGARGGGPASPEQRELPVVPTSPAPPNRPITRTE